MTPWAGCERGRWVGDGRQAERAKAEWRAGLLWCYCVLVRSAYCMLVLPRGHARDRCRMEAVGLPWDLLLCTVYKNTVVSGWWARGF